MDIKEALLCAKICRLTYVDQYEFKNFQLTARFENEGTNTQGLFGLAYNRDAVIAFRGSEETSIADWITDLKFVKQEYPYAGTEKKNIKVHHGFMEAYRSVRDTILAEAKKTKCQRIIFTGHSLGAALAMLAALDVDYNVSGKEYVCYTFGAPKVGNDAFAKSYNKRVPETFRVVNIGDYIADLPPGSFEHCGQLCSIGETMSSSLLDVAAKLKAHIPNTYIEVLQKMLK